MILKITTETGFKIWDDINNIEIKEGCVFVQINSDYDGTDGRKLVEYKYSTDVLRIHCNEVIVADNKSANPNCTILKAFRNHSEPVTITFDTPGWLTNDQGKTIEKL